MLIFPLTGIDGPEVSRSQLLSQLNLGPFHLKFLKRYLLKFFRARLSQATHQYWVLCKGKIIFRKLGGHFPVQGVIWKVGKMFVFIDVKTVSYVFHIL